MERSIILNKKNFIFSFSILIKFLAVFLILPGIQDEWFIGFIRESIQNPSLDPWSNYLSNSGDILAFPYGPIMYLLFIPFSLLFLILGIPFGIEEYSIGIGFRLTILIFDFIGYYLLSKLLVNKEKEIILFYWISPLIFYVSYIYGQLDIVPTTILIIAYYFLYKNKFKLSGIFFGLSIAAKLSFALVIPFPLIYLWQNKRLVTGLKPFIKYFSAIIFFFVLIPIISNGYRQMVLGTPQKEQLLWLNFALNNDVTLYILPIIYLTLIYLMWRIKRSNFTLILSITGLTLLLTTLLMPPSPGWYLWALPFLIIYQIKTDINGKLLICLFSILQIIIIFPKDIFSKIKLLNFEIQYNTEIINNLTQNLFYTLFIGLGFIIALRIYRESIQKNDYHRLSKRAISIGIAGGPSTGKGTLSNAIIDILGKRTTTLINEKNYIKWHKNKKFYSLKNLVKVDSQDLLKLNTDLNLIINKDIINRKNINSSVSNFSNKYFDDDFILVNGYHLFLPYALNSLFDIKIFLNPEFELNRNWILKNKNHFNLDEKESLKILKVYEEIYSQQKKSSDLIFEFSYINKEILSYKEINNLPLKMNVYLKDGIYAENLSKALISICGVKLNMDISNTDFSAKLSVEGEIWSEDIKLAAYRLIPNLEEIIDSNPAWQSDTIGLMQLIVLMQISYFLRYYK